MKEALERLNLKRNDFPLKISLSSGETHFLTSPKHIDMRPKSETLVLFPADSFIEFVNAKDVVSIKRRARRRKAG